LVFLFSTSLVCWRKISEMNLKSGEEEELTWSARGEGAQLLIDQPLSCFPFL
jgi:hypothetical protein